MQRFSWLFILFVLSALLLFSTCATVIHQNEQAVVTRFGKAVRVIDKPGLFWRWPRPIEKVYRFDNRIHTYETRYTETLTRDRRNIILVTFVAWRVADPLTFLQALGTVENAEEKLDGIVTHAKNTVLGEYDFASLFSMEKSKQKITEIEGEILQEVRDAAGKELGLEIVQVGFERLAFPEQNLDSVLQQMRAEREQYAAKYRAEGDQEASAIRSDTDLKVAQILAEAQRKADEIRGNAEAQAAQIYASVQKSDPEFYEFLQSLESLEKLLQGQSTVILKTDSPPFRILRSLKTEKPENTMKK